MEGRFLKKKKSYRGKLQVEKLEKRKGDGQV